MTHSDQSEKCFAALPKTLKVQRYQSCMNLLLTPLLLVVLVGLLCEIRVIYMQVLFFILNSEEDLKISVFTGQNGYRV